VTCIFPEGTKESKDVHKIKEEKEVAEGFQEQTIYCISI
jgi:hypothetical protein